MRQECSFPSSLLCSTPVWPHAITLQSITDTALLATGSGSWTLFTLLTLTLSLRLKGKGPDAASPASPGARQTSDIVVFFSQHCHDRDCHRGRGRNQVSHTWACVHTPMHVVTRPCSGINEVELSASTNFPLCFSLLFRVFPALVSAKCYFLSSCEVCIRDISVFSFLWFLSYSI